MNDLQGLIDSVGAMAEMTGLYRAELLKQNIPESEVIRYTAAFITAAMGGGKSGQA